MRSRIFYLITELDVGGAEKALYALVTHLDRRRFEPCVGCLTGRGTIGGWLEKEGVTVTYFDMRGWSDLAAWMRVRRTLRAWRPDIVHSYLFHANLMARLASPGLGVRRVISSVRVEEPRRWHLWLDWLTHPLADKVACVSRSVCQYMRRRAGIPRHKLAVVPNGIDVAAYGAPPPPVPQSGASRRTVPW